MKEDRPPAPSKGDSCHRPKWSVGYLFFTFSLAFKGVGKWERDGKWPLRRSTEVATEGTLGCSKKQVA